MRAYYKIILLILILVIVFLIYKGIISPGKYDAFALCLTEEGVSMGGTDWCHFCKEQKAKFGKSFKYIDYHNCDFEKEWCLENNIKAYPTWLVSGETYRGVKELSDLASLSGCEL